MICFWFYYRLTCRFFKSVILGDTSVQRVWAQAPSRDPPEWEGSILSTLPLKISNWKNTGPSQHQALCHCLHLLFITGPLQLTTSTVRISTISLLQLEKQVKRNAKSAGEKKLSSRQKLPLDATAPKRAYSRAERGKEGIRHYKSVKSFNRYLHFPTSGCRQQAGCS